MKFKYSTYLFNNNIFLLKLRFKKIDYIQYNHDFSHLFFYNSENEIVALYERKKHKIDEIINKVKNEGMEIYDISTNEGNLEDVFIDLTKD